MIFNGIKYFLLVTTVAVTGLSVMQPQKPKTGFWAMDGTLVTHYFEDKTDSLSGPEIYELSDDNGLPLWFSRHIFKDVCISGTCKMIRLWLFWDGAGNYLGMHIPEDEPLTKSDHTLFESADYEKLNGILLDTASMLEDLKQEDLIIVPDSIDPYEVDGYTAATQPTLAEVVVEEAVYTCHTLWHTVYGPVQDTIFEILNHRVSEEFLDKMFSSQKTEFILWAINALNEHPIYHPQFYPKVMDQLSSGNIVLEKIALNYFQPNILADTTIQIQLTEAMAGVDMSVKYEILWKFIGYGNINETAVINLLKMFHNEEIGVGAYNLILRLITAQHLTHNQQISLLINSLTENENAYIRNLTARKLDAMK